MKLAPILLLASLTTVTVYGTERADTVTELNEVVVTGTNASVARNLLPYTVSVIGNERLESTGRTQVLSALSGMVPSLFVPSEVFSDSVSAMVAPATSNSGVSEETVPAVY